VEIVRDSHGRIAELRYGDGRVSSFAFDEAGKLIEARNGETSTRYRYDDEGRVVEEDQGGAVVRYSYNAIGMLHNLIWPDGACVSHEYDADARPLTVEDWTGRLYHFSHSSDDRRF